jgi:hypothetical protein
MQVSLFSHLFCFVDTIGPACCEPYALAASQRAESIINKGFPSSSAPPRGIMTPLAVAIAFLQHFALQIHVLQGQAKHSRKHVTVYYYEQ